MFPEPQIEGGLNAWKKTEPLGAAWDTEERRADVLSFTPEGKDEKIFVTGLRNCAGLTVQPATGELWCAVDERDASEMMYRSNTPHISKKAHSTDGPGSTLAAMMTITRVRGQTLRKR